MNSLDTARKLAAVCRSDAEIVVYRPKVRNVFDVDPTAASMRSRKTTLRLLSIGTVEPRKNYRYAARIVPNCAEGWFCGRDTGDRRAQRLG